MSSPRVRFGALAGLGFLLVLLETLRASNQIFDFWEHAATVRAFMLHPGNPGNPLLAVHTPSAFFSPYLLLVALGAKLTGAGPVHALAAAGLINYWLLVAGIWWFTRVFSERPQAPFYALLFAWLLWGVDPWKYSGFFNLRSLGAVIAYPSTFAAGLGMLTAALWHHGIGRPGRKRWLVAVIVALGLAVVGLTHPVAGAATAAAILAVSLTVPERGGAVLGFGLVVAGAALLCLGWPYFGVLRLLGDQGVYDPSNSLMYSAWLTRVFPILAALGLIFWRTGTLRRARLAIYCAPLLGLFIYGGLSGHYGEGRVISFLVLGAQIGLADLAATLEQTALARLRRPVLALVAGTAALCLGAELYNNRGGLRGSLPGTGSEPGVYAAYRAAVNGLPAQATIATPLNDGAEAAIPVFGGRLVGTHRPLAFVKDQVARRQALDGFFSPQATTGYHRQFLHRYRVRYVVVPPALVNQLGGIGPVIRRGGRFATIAVSG